MHFITKAQQMSDGVVRTVGDEQAASAELRLLRLSFASLSSPKVTRPTFCSSEDRITLKYGWCPAERDAFVCVEQL